jgi:glycerophosphoryl diester phosphodiesterase
MKLPLLTCLALLSAYGSAVAQPRPPDIQGHRGCRGLMPENTIPAMRKALVLGVKTLEMDIAISQDKQVLLSHDPFMNADFVYRPDGSPIPKAEEKTLRLFGMPYAEIRRYDVGSHGNPKFPRQQQLATYKPLLAEVIDSAEAYALHLHRPTPYYNIETKTTPAGDGTYHPAPDEFVRLLLAVVMAKGIQERVIIQSFDPRTLEVVHRLQRLSFRPTIYSPNYKLVNAELVQACHRQKLLIIPWTVNTTADAAQLAQSLDGLITDYPDLFMAK